MDQNWISSAGARLLSLRRHRRWLRLVVVLAAVVVFVTTYLLILPAITLEGPPICGLPEHTHEAGVCYHTEPVLTCTLAESTGHTHTEACYTETKTLVCTEAEGETHTHTEACYRTDRTLTCGLEESAGHTHTESCYTEEMVWTCELEEHTHTSACYAKEEAPAEEPAEEEPSASGDTTADLETAADWEATLAGVTLTGDWSEDVLAVAESQLGYTESSRNYITVEGDRKGYTRYGAWYGAPYDDWCAMFVSFCLHYAEVEGIPANGSCPSWVSLLSSGEYDRFRAAESYTPAAGDLIFFDGNQNGTADHVGLVTGVTPATADSPATVETIEGNAGDAVRRRSYPVTDGDILGYGVLPTEPEATGEQVLTAILYLDESYTKLLEEPDTVITVTGNLPADAQVWAYPVTPEGEEAALCAYDIAIVLPDGTFYEPDASVKVSIQSAALAEKVQDPHLHPEVYYLPEEGEPQPMESTLLEDGVSFSTHHFSVYMVLAVQGTQVKNATELKEAIERKDPEIQLAADFSVSGSITVPDAAITLDLNGHVLTHTGTANPLFVVPAGATFVVGDSQMAPETKSTGGSSVGNAASLALNGSTATLTYYVTTSQVTNSTTGATAETLEIHTLTTTGAIVGSSRPVFSVTGGTLELESGMIRSGTGRAVNQTGGTTQMTGGVLCGFTRSSTSLANNTGFGGAVKITGGSLNLTSGVIAANTAQNGGAIYASGNAKLSITGGVISGNTANRTTSGWNDHSESGTYRCGGGGIYADGTASIDMSGGYLTNNVATHDGYFDGGGGICLSGTSGMTLSGGYVTGNRAQGGGGIRTDFGKQTTFMMTGGFVSANMATHSEGGGIAIDRGGVGTVTAGYVTNNNIPTTGHWGGGGLFCADGSTLNLKNALITQNTAGGFGAGVAGCPTGNLYLYVTEGCAIFDNTDTVNSDSPHYTSDGIKQIDKEICTEVFQANGHEDFFCALNSTVTGTMLGGGAAHWQGSADYQPVVADAEDLLAATRVMGLTAHPSETDKSQAQAAAKLYINGNYSYTHGGGIMCNGNLVVGVPKNIEVPVRIQLEAQKLFLDGSGSTLPLEDNNFSFRVTMTDVEGTVIAEGVCDADGTIRFDHQITLKENGTFVYYVYETLPEEEDPTIVYDEVLYKLSVTVQRDSGVDWYGDTLKYSYQITHLVVEKSTDQGKSWSTVSDSTAVSSGVVSLPLTSGAAFTNRLVEPTKITVQKKWEGGVGTESVTVILKKDGEEVSRQTLSSQNKWTYTWENLEPGFTYTVEEVPVPGYSGSYETTITQDTDGQVSQGSGSWWVPATTLTVGQKYILVSADGTKVLSVASGNEGDGFNTADVANVSLQETLLTINGQTYTSWYEANAVSARSIYVAKALTRDSHSGIIFKRSDEGSYPYLRLEDNNNNYLKGASTTTYASFLTFDGLFLRGHNASEWTPDNLRTFIFENGKFNTTTEQSPANGAKLYTLVEGEGYTGTVSESSTVTITNTRDSGYVLPETGGPGTQKTVLGGLLLMGSAALLSIRRRMRRKEGPHS